MRDCKTQVRIGGMGTPYALDYAAVYAVAAARQVDMAFLSDVLPAVEPVLIASLQKKGSSS